MVKEKIIEAALERFMQYGIRNMTILKLIEPMGISTKTVYKYFTNKEELLEECLNLLYGGYYNELNTIVSTNDNVVNKLRLLFRTALGRDFGMNHTFFHDLNYYYPELQNAAIGQTKLRYGALMVPLIEEGIKEGYFLDHLEPELALNGIGTLYALITRSEDYKDYPGSPHKLFENLVEVYIRGMCTEKGIKEIENNPYHNKEQ